MYAIRSYYEYGWADGVYNATSKKVYQMNLETGSVSKGQYFYVGGYARMICSYYQLIGVITSYSIHYTKLYELSS